MKIHTNVLTERDIYAVAHDLPGVYVDGVRVHGSRSHARRFDVHLTRNSSRRPNRGTYGGGCAATWDEWGVYLARLFDIDSKMVVGDAKRTTYEDASDFHRKTSYRFASLALPLDTHRQHRWAWGGGGGARCTWCSATWQPS